MPPRHRQYSEITTALSSIFISGTLQDAFLSTINEYVLVLGSATCRAAQLTQLALAAWWKDYYNLRQWQEDFNVLDEQAEGFDLQVEELTSAYRESSSSLKCTRFLRKPVWPRGCTERNFRLACSLRQSHFSHRSLVTKTYRTTPQQRQDDAGDVDRRRRAGSKTHCSYRAPSCGIPS